MAAHPLIGMAAASAACFAIVLLAVGAAGSREALLGAMAPLAAALATWLIVARVHATAPARVSGAMIKLFGAKMVFFGGYIAAVALLLPSGRHTAAFAASFVCQYVLLHLMEALYLRRLFSTADDRLRAS